MPIIPKPGAFSDGEKVSGLVCRHCGAGMPLAHAADEMPDSFFAQCPMCRKRDHYSKGEIQTLVAHRKQ